MTYLHQPTGLTPGGTYRVDSDTGTVSAAAIARVDPSGAIPGSVVKADASGQAPMFTAEAQQLHLKRTDTTGATVASNGWTYPEGAVAVTAPGAMANNFRGSTPTAFMPRRWYDTGVTDATGVVTFAIPAGLFTAVYQVNPTPIRNVATSTNCHVKTATTSSVVIQCSQSKSTAVSLLGINVLGLEAAPSGVTVTVEIIGT